MFLEANKKHETVNIFERAEKINITLYDRICSLCHFLKHVLTWVLFWRSNTPLNHVVQEAPVVDLPFGRSVLPGFLKGPHHVTRRWSHKGVQVPTPRDPSLQPGLKTHRDGWSHGWKREGWGERKKWNLGGCHVIVEVLYLTTVLRYFYLTISILWYFIMLLYTLILC